MTTLPPGSYVVTATVDFIDNVNADNTVICELRHNASFMGTQKTAMAEGYQDWNQYKYDIAALTVTGGAALAGTGDISFWCRAEGHDATPHFGLFGGGQLMILQVGGFF